MPRRRIPPRYPDHDPRGWPELHDLPIRLEVTPVSGQWVQDPRERSGWRWDGQAPAADPSPTRIQNLPVPPRHKLGTPRQETPVTQPDRDDVIPSSPHVLDLSVGADGGGHDGVPDVPAIDPYAPVRHVDDLGFGQGSGQHYPDRSTEGLVVCPTCGSGVHRDRIVGGNR